MSGKNMKRVILALAGALLLALALAFILTPAGAERLPDYVVDSGIETTRVEYAWIDDERVLVTGPQKDESGRVVKKWPALYVWRVGGNTKHLFDMRLSRFCYGDGTIRYVAGFTETKPAARIVMTRRYTPAEGGLGPPARLEVLKSPEYRFSRYTCLLEPRPAFIKSYGWAPLRPGDGYFEFEGGTEARNPLLFHRGSGRGQTLLDIPEGLVFTSCLRFHPFKGAYFLTSCSVSDRYTVDGCPTVWWLWPDGRTEAICVSNGPGGSGVWATRVGMVMTTKRPDRRGSIGPSGLYLWSGGRARRILRGWIDEVAVSPDGCRIAFDHNFDFWKLNATAKMIDLCALVKTLD